MTLLEIINEYFGKNFSNIEEALEQYSARELFSGWLNYEGIIGYTDKLLGVMDDLGFLREENFPAAHMAPYKPEDIVAERRAAYRPVDKRAERRLRDASGTKESPDKQAAPYKPEDIIFDRQAAHRPVDKRAERHRREINMALSLLKEDVPRKWENRLKRDSCNIKTMPINEMVKELVRRTSAQSLTVSLGDEVTLKPGEPTQILTFPISWLQTPGVPISQAGKELPDKQTAPCKPGDIMAERHRRDAIETKTPSAPDASMYEKADKYLESILLGLNRSDDPASFETLKTVVYIAKLNQLFHQIETSPNHGKAEAIGRLLGTDFLEASICATGENTLELTLRDAIRRCDVLKMAFTDRSYLCKLQGFGPLIKEQNRYTRTGQSFL